MSETHVIAGQERRFAPDSVSSDQPRFPIRNDLDAIMVRSEPPDLKGVGQALARAKLFLVACMILGLAGGVGYLLVATPEYTSQMTVGPNRDSPANIGSGALGGAASLLSFAKDDEYVSPFQMFLEAFNSMDMADRLLGRPDLVGPLLKIDWDEQGGRWIRKHGLKSRLADLLNNFFGRPEFDVPTRADVAQALKKTLSITQISRSALYGIRVDHVDPDYALTLLRFTFEQADAIVRETSAERARALVADLDQRIAKIGNMDVRSSLITFMSDQQKTLSLTSLPTPFSVTVFDPPVVSEIPTSPLIIRTMVFSVLVGLLVGSGLVVLRARLRVQK